MQNKFTDTALNKWYVEEGVSVQMAQKEILINVEQTIFRDE